MQEKTNPNLSHPVEATPEPGEAIEIRKGIYWIRLPIPFELNHINVWLLEDNDGYTLVDTGISSKKTCAAWDRIFKDVIKEKSINRIIVTHFHPDHFGLVHWLCERTNAAYFASEETIERVNFLLGMQNKNHLETRMSFYQQHQITDIDFFEDFLKGSLYAAVVSGRPENNNIVSDGECLSIGEHEWQAIMTYGHAPGHINLYCKELNMLISGDQVLPTITSNVSVHADQPEENPLQDYLASFLKMEFLPSDTLVLPSHGKVFEGLHQRIKEVVDHHGDKLEEVYSICERAHSASELLPKLFRRKLEGINSVLAFGETLAHLNYLCKQERLQRNLQKGKYIFEHLT